MRRTILIAAALASAGLAAPAWSAPAADGHMGSVPILAVERGYASRPGDNPGRIEVFNQYGGNRLTYSVAGMGSQTTRDACPAIEPFLTQLEEGVPMKASVKPADDTKTFIGPQTDVIDALAPDGSQIHFNSSASAALGGWVDGLFAAVAACVKR